MPSSFAPLLLSIAKQAQAVGCTALRAKPLHLAGCLALATGVSAFALPSFFIQPAPVEPATTADPLVSWPTPSLAQEALPPIYIERTVAIEPRETLMDTLKRAGLSADQANQLIIPLSKEKNAALRNLRPGQTVTLSYKEEAPQHVGAVLALNYHTVADKTAQVERSTTGAYLAKVVDRELSKKKGVAVGRIEGSLYHAAQKAGLPAALVPQFAELFSYELDFTRDIKPGDPFKVVYEEIRDEKTGEFLRTGAILAAELTAAGQTRSAYRFSDNGQVDYYAPDGTPKRKLLMRTPLETYRISSHFNLNRKHPVLGFTRAHRGTDFAAPVGTPIKASGDGVIERADYWGSFGNYIRIRHNNTYKTAYAHLHKFARGIRSGTRVKQGQIIGYVGNTGRSTGPHLHYEVHVNGKQVDPMRAKIPAGNPLNRAKKQTFLAMVDDYRKLWRAEEDAIRLAAAE